MLKVEYDPPHAATVWAEGQLGFTRFTQQAHTLAVKRNGLMCAVVVFDRFAGPDCEISVVSLGDARWLNREILVRVAAYPFVQLELDRVTAFIDVTNHRALRFVQHVGFKYEGTKRHPLGPMQVMMWGLLKSECRWLSQVRPRLRNAA